VTKDESAVPLREHLEALLAERDLRFQQRYDAQRVAMDAALAAADKAVQAALLAAKEAVIKAETAAEKRFDCVSADTPILCADLVWRPAGDLLIGDEIIAFDEESPSRRGRRFRKATVTDNSLARDALLLVTTPEGSVRCNAHHPWLVRRADRTGTWRWVKAENLRPGDAVMHAIDPWEVDRSWEAGWLAGMYDGEGCLCFDKNGSVQLTVTQRESETATKLDAALKDRIGSFVAHRTLPGTPSARKNTVPFYHYIISARSSVMKILGNVRPPRLLITSDQIWEGKPIGGKHRSTVITSIEPAGTGTIAQLSTSTRTYIAGGFAMHNSVNEFRGAYQDVIALQIPRAEAEQRLGQLAEKVELNTAALNAVRQDVSNVRSRSAAYTSAMAAIVAVATVVFIIIQIGGM